MTNFISLKDDWIDGAIFRLPENQSPKKRGTFYQNSGKNIQI